MLQQYFLRLMLYQYYLCHSLQIINNQIFLPIVFSKSPLNDTHNKDRVEHFLVKVILFDIMLHKNFAILRCF